MRDSGTSRILEEIEYVGYCVVPGLLPGAHCDELIDACRDAHAQFATFHAEAPSTAAVHGTENVALVHNLHNKAQVFRDLIFHPIVDAVADSLLSAGSYEDSEPYQLALSQARGLTGPHPAQQLHIDSYLPGLPYVLVLQAAWILNDFTQGSGATCVVPGSRDRREFAENGVEYPDLVTIEADRGSLLLFDGGMWHGSSLKTTHEERWVIFNRYSRWFMRPSFDIARNTPRSVYDELTDHQREILGFRYNPPLDEFTRATRISERSEFTNSYTLPADT